MSKNNLNCHIICISGMDPPGGVEVGTIPQLGFKPKLGGAGGVK